MTGGGLQDIVYINSDSVDGERNQKALGGYAINQRAGRNLERERG
jgi:hypothetical protein